jgi:adenosylcobinamide-GDP ribazoletransferase
MSGLRFVRGAGTDFLGAVEFLTRIPVPAIPYAPDSLSRAVKFFPLVGLLLGCVAAVLHQFLVPHLPRFVAALLVVTSVALLTGLLHEDGLADAADGFGGGHSREQVLVILKDSRIGSYGGAALVLTFVARTVLLASLPLAHVTAYLITAHVLARWTTLPLSCYLAPARVPDEAVAGQGARLARLTTRGTLVAGTLLSFATAILALRLQAGTALAAAVLMTLLTGFYFQRRIGGVTGDCFGATNQLTEIAVYLTGAWVA